MCPPEKIRFNLVFKHYRHHHMNLYEKLTDKMKNINNFSVPKHITL